MSRLHTPRAGMPLTRALFHAASRILFVLALALAALGGALFMAPRAAHAATAPGNAIVTVGTSNPNAPNGDACQVNDFGQSDDGSSAAQAIPFTANFFGNSYNSLYVNNNGNVTFGTALGTYTPFNLTGDTNIPIIAPFFADVDTDSYTHGQTTHYSDGTGTYLEHRTFCVDWVNVGVYGGATNPDGSPKLNSFQLLLVDRSDTGAGNFDIWFNYDKIQWETGSASGGTNGLGGTCAGVGYSSGSGTNTTSFQLPGSGQCGALLDTNPTTGAPNTATGLIYNNNDPDVANPTPGRYVYQVRNGTTTTGNTVLTGRVLDGTNTNAPLFNALVSACDTHGFCSDATTGLDGFYTFTGLRIDPTDPQGGAFTLTAYPPAGRGLNASTVGATAQANQTVQAPDLILTGPTPPPGPNEPNASSLGSPTVGNMTTDIGGVQVPVVYWEDNVVLTTHGCPGGQGHYTITTHDSQTGADVTLSGDMTETPAGSGAFTHTLAPLYPDHGASHIEMTVDNCPQGETPTEPASFDFYIDPSGLVTDATTNAGIQGAAVTLLAQDPNNAATFNPVANGSAVMSPSNRNNPDTTHAGGLFGWDVLAGTYRIRASAPGYTCPTTLPSGYHCLSDGTTVETDDLVVSPSHPITDLDFPLQSVGGNGGGTGGGTDTPELGSGELLATGLLPIVGLVLYRRRQSRRTRTS